MRCYLEILAWLNQAAQSPEFDPGIIKWKWWSYWGYRVCWQSWRFKWIIEWLRWRLWFRLWRWRLHAKANQWKEERNRYWWYLICIKQILYTNLLYSYLAHNHSAIPIYILICIYMKILCWGITCLLGAVSVFLYCFLSLRYVTSLEYKNSHIEIKRD